MEQVQLTMCGPLAYLLCVFIYLFLFFIFNVVLVYDNVDYCGPILSLENLIDLFVNRYDIKLNNAILAEDKHLPM
jgi:hypothetical protein